MSSSLVSWVDWWYLPKILFLGAEGQTDIVKRFTGDLRYDGLLSCHIVDILFDFEHNIHYNLHSLGHLLGHFLAYI